MNQRSIALSAALPAPSAYTPANDAPSTTEIAHTTLLAGCRFLMARAADARADAPAARNAGERHVRLRVAGNHLKELDRFLEVLIAACHLPRGALALPVAGVHRPRLRAIGRLRAAACQGHAERFGTRFIKDLAVAAPGLDRNVPSTTTPPPICAATLAEIAHFYLSLAEVLVAAHGQHAVDLDFAGVLPHMDRAIVVCDGN